MGNLLFSVKFFVCKCWFHASVREGSYAIPHATLLKITDNWVFHLYSRWTHAVHLTSTQQGTNTCNSLRAGALQLPPHLGTKAFI